MSKRLFIGLELPDSIKDDLLRLDPKIPRLRWLGPAQMHLTMSFLGDVAEPEEARLKEALESVNVKPFWLPVRGVGAFGGARPTVVWAGVGKAHPHLFALHKHLQDAVLAAGIEADLRPFKPHITIGRARGVSREMLNPFLKAHRETEIGLWKVESFALFSSVLMREEAIHSVEMRKALVE